MPTRDVVLLQDDFSSGSVLNVARHLIPVDGAYKITDGFLNEDGSVYRRGGTSWKSNAAFGTQGTFLWDGWMAPGQRTVFANAADFGVLGSNDASPVNIGGPGLLYPKAAAYLQGLLFIGGGFIYGGSRKTANYVPTGGNTHITNGSAVVTDASGGFSAGIDPGMMMQRADERLYVVASVDSDTQVTLTEPYEGATTTTADPVFRVLHTITAPDPYEAAEVYVTVQRRLMWAKGNVIGFSEVDKPHDQTNQFGTVNSHTLPEGVSITALGAIGSGAVIGTTAGLWTLSGMAFDIVDAEGNPQHRLSVLSRDLIPFGHSGIATWEQLLVMPCTDGVYLVDGVSSPILISRAIEPLYARYTTQFFRAGGAAVYRNHYLLPILDTAGKARDLLACRLSRQALDRRRRPAFPWTFLTGKGGSLISLAVRSSDLASSSASPVLLGMEGEATARVANATSYFFPDAPHKRDPDGTNHKCDVILRDIETGGSTLNTIRNMRARYELTDVGDDPVVQGAWSDGATSGEVASWGEVDWGQFEWAAGAGQVFYSLTPDGPPDSGTNPHRWPINKFRRFIRPRISSEGATAGFVLRGVEVTVMPSQAGRR